MKRIFALLMMLLLALPAPLLMACAEEEVDFFQVVMTPTPAPDPFAPVATATVAPTATPVRQPDGSTIITLTAVGDVTIGRNVQHSGASIFEKELKKQGGDVNFIFRNIKDVFEADDLTIVNFEGTLADTYSIPSKKKNNSYLFLAPYDYAAVLPANGVEAAMVENNHVEDFGEDGKASTISALEGAGVVWADAEHLGIYETQGKRIGLLAYQTLNQPITSAQLKLVVDKDIREAKEEKGCDIVVVSFHWGEELDYSPRDNQVMLGRAAIDSGADLVLGHHSHRINPIECYKGKYIVYSLANCSFAGNNKPSDMNTFIFQLRLRYKAGSLTDTFFRIIPCRISSRTDYNDFAITPLTDTSNINTVLNNLKTTGKKLEYAVAQYPLEWE